MPADAWGITDAYDDSRGERRRTPAVTRQALRAAMGGDSADPRPPRATPPWSWSPGGAARRPSLLAS